MIHDPNLPWGHWLSYEPVGATSAFIDPEGRQWPTIRHALWCGRLGMPPLSDDKLPEEQLELLAVALACNLSPSARATYPDLFQTLPLNNFYYGWLVSQRLLSIGSDKYATNSGLTNEGMSALRMLEATRPVPVRDVRPGRASIDLLLEIARGPVIGEERRRKVEAEASSWHAAFLRRSIAGRAAVILTRRGEGPIPVQTTVWMLRLPDERARDGFYDWLCDHLDRWPAWAGIAAQYSAPELTQHMLAVLSEGSAQA